MKKPLSKVTTSVLTTGIPVKFAYVRVHIPKISLIVSNNNKLYVWMYIFSSEPHILFIVTASGSQLSPT